MYIIAIALQQNIILGGTKNQGRFRSTAQLTSPAPADSLEDTVPRPTLAPVGDTRPLCHQPLVAPRVLTRDGLHQVGTTRQGAHGIHNHLPLPHPKAWKKQS